MSDQPPRARLAAMSWDGRFVAIREKDGVAIVDALGTAPRVSLGLEDVCDFGCIDTALWVATGGQIRRFSLPGGNEIGSPIRLAQPRGRLRFAGGQGATAAVWSTKDEASVIRVQGDHLELEELPGELSRAGFVSTLSGRKLVANDGSVVLVYERSDATPTGARLPNGGMLADAAEIMAGRALVVLTRSDDQAHLVVFGLRGAKIHNVELPPVELCTIAESRALAVVYTKQGQLLSVDLRFGRVLRKAAAPIELDELQIDGKGRYLVLAGFRDDQLSVLHVSYPELFGGRRVNRPASTDGEEQPQDDAPASPGSDAFAAELEGEADPRPDEAPAKEPAAPVESGPLPDVHLAALAPSRKTEKPSARPADARPYTDATDHLDDLLALAAALAGRAIADAWDSGRLSIPSADGLPFEREVLALTGVRANAARDAVVQAERRVAAVSERINRRQHASLVAEVPLPFNELAAQFELSLTARLVALVVAAPALRGDIARLYGILANDEARPICDRFLVEQLVAGQHAHVRHQVAAELAPEAPLLRHGLVRVANASFDQYLFAALSVDPVVLARVRGLPHEGTGPSLVTQLRQLPRDALETLAVPESLKHHLVRSLAVAPREPVRLVIRGRRGTGRRTLAAALAARAGRPLAVIATERLQVPRPRLAAAVGDELERAALRGAIPCISGLDWLDADDRDANEQLRNTLRAHAGPVILRSTREHRPPLDPGYLDVTIPPLSETQRRQFWSESLARHGLQASETNALASRYRVGPGTIETVVQIVARWRSTTEPADDDASDDLDIAARQHIETRLGSVATRIHRLATWDQVALPYEVIDSIREFMGRVEHRRRVYEDWGYESRISSARGLTALFHGPPGTGKSMVAGLIARELGLDLYRIDLAQITSKWIGETEKNLAEVFDAAEDGQAVILFDEADSLFAKRTDVKSSVDRYANLEVNYLLQRLDSFEGVAILTTNLEGSLDSAFKRRLSLRLAFPFPDEEMRVQLWQAHIPPEVPTTGDFDFEALARKHLMSGGYIRNSALRAAFLAAQEGEPLSQEHIERAIHLEYREMGKLAPGGRLE